MAAWWHIFRVQNLAGLARPGRLSLPAIRFVLAALGILLAASLPAAADDVAAPRSTAAGDGEAGLFQRLDANADGALRLDEVPAEKQRLLARLIRAADKNGDGQLSREEFATGLKSAAAQRLAGSDPQNTAEQGVGDRARAGARPDAAAIFRRMDRNGDGQVTKDEVPEERRERFGRLLSVADENGDAALTSEEFAKNFARAGGGRPGEALRPKADSANSPSAGPSGLAAAVLAALDKNTDGQLSADELRSASDSLLALDKNGDGTITAAELERRRPPSSAPLAAAGGPDPDRAWQRVLAGDRNGDGKLTEAELPDRLQRAFSRLDANGDGSIDESEFKTGLERIRAARGEKP